MLGGKRAVVTGAGKGIGYDLSVTLAKHGVTVIAVTRTQADLDKLVAEVSYCCIHRMNASTTE